MLFQLSLREPREHDGQREEEQGAKELPHGVFAVQEGQRVANRGEAAAKNAILMTRYYGAKSMQTVELAARKVIAAVAEGDMLRTQMAILRRLSKFEPSDTITLGRQIAQQVTSTGRYTV